MRSPKRIIQMEIKVKSLGNMSREGEQGFLKGIASGVVNKMRFVMRGYSKL